MKKLLTLILILSVTVNLFAIDSPIYRQNSLSITLGSRNWKAFQGEAQISKAEFFTLVGEEELADAQRVIDQQNNKNKKTAKILYGVGGATAIIGLTIESLFLLSGHEPTTSIDMPLLGAGIAVTGIGLALLGLSFDFKSNAQQPIATNLLIGLTEEYNIQLLATLTK